MTKIKVIIPTYNAGAKFQNVLNMVKLQKDLEINDILVIDSSSQDQTRQIVRDAGIELITISKNEFGHGKTRRLAVEKVGDADIILFLTQDALLYDEFSVKNLCEYFKMDEAISAVFGRQIPYAETDVFGAHARIFNYPAKSAVKSFADKEKYGLKTAFFSDTFGAYKRNVLLEMGNFPDVNFGEDTYIAAKMLMSGYKIGYCADAKIYHSHTFSIFEDFRRCKDIGRFHHEQRWLLETFGKAEGEGLKFVKSQARYLMKQEKWYLLPELVVRNGMKYLGYKLGV